MSGYELVKKLGSYDNFKGLKSMAKVPGHKLFAQNKLSTPTVSEHASTHFRLVGARMSPHEIPSGPPFLLKHDADTHLILKYG